MKYKDLVYPQKCNTNIWYRHQNMFLYFGPLNVFGYLFGPLFGLKIISDICLFTSWASPFVVVRYSFIQLLGIKMKFVYLFGHCLSIWIVVWSTLVKPNIFGYLFGYSKVVGQVLSLKRVRFRGWTYITSNCF